MSPSTYVDAECALCSHLHTLLPKQHVTVSCNILQLILILIFAVHQSLQNQDCGEMWAPCSFIG